MTAVDNGGHTAHTVVTVHLEDVNDLAPKFKKKIYQGFMTPDMSRLALIFAHNVEICVLDVFFVWVPTFSSVFLFF